MKKDLITILNATQDIEDALRRPRSDDQRLVLRKIRAANARIGKAIKNFYPD